MTSGVLYFVTFIDPLHIFFSEYLFKPFAIFCCCCFGSIGG
jgi:hypothetical protein